MQTFINNSTYEFTDISSELFRTYTFKGGEEVTIPEPLQLSVSKTGHRVFDASGTSHYVPFGWLQIKWKVKEGAPNFVK